MSSTNERRLRIGLLSVYFGLFDAAMPPEFRQDRTAFAEGMRERLERFGSVVYPGVVDSDDTGKEAGRIFADAEVDVIVFAPTMAAPSQLRVGSRPGPSAGAAGGCRRAGTG